MWASLCVYLQRWVPEGRGRARPRRRLRRLQPSHPRARRVAFDANPGLPDLVEAPIEAEVGDVTDLTRFPDETFDVAFASNLLEHLAWPELERAIAEIRRVLRPGGRFIAVQPNFRMRPREYFDDYTHRTIFTDRSLGDFLAASGFTIEHVEPRFLPLTMKSRLSFGHALVPLYLRLPYRPLAGQMLVVAGRA